MVRVHGGSLAVALALVSVLSPTLAQESDVLFNLKGSISENLETLRSVGGRRSPDHPCCGKIRVQIGEEVCPRAVGTYHLMVVNEDNLPNGEVMYFDLREGMKEAYMITRYKWTMDDDGEDDNAVSWVLTVMGGSEYTHCDRVLWGERADGDATDCPVDPTLFWRVLDVYGQRYHELPILVECEPASEKPPPPPPACQDLNVTLKEEPDQLLRAFDALEDTSPAEMEMERLMKQMLIEGDGNPMVDLLRRFQKGHESGAIGGDTAAALRVTHT